MDCEKYQQRLSEYIDNRLPEGQESAFEEHLSECADCQEELERLQRTVEAVADLGKQDAPAGFADGVMAAIRRQESMVPGEPEQSKIISLVPLFSGVAAAFLIVLGMAFALGPGIQKVGGPPEPRRMARAHDEIADAERPEGPSPPKAEGTPPGMGGAGYGGYGGGYGAPMGGYGGAYGGGGPYRGGRRDALQRSPEQSTQGQPGAMDRAAEKETRARRMAPRGSSGPGSGQVRALSIESMEEKPRAAVFNQMVANKVPESLLKRRPDRVITLRAKEPMQAVRQVVKLANDQQVGVQLRFVPSPVQGRDNVELAMEVSHTVYNMLARDLARAFGVKRNELLSMGLSTDVGKETAYMYLGEAMRKSEPDAKPAEKDDSQSVRKELKQTEAGEGLAMRQESKAQAEKGGEDEKAEQQKPRPAEEGENIKFLVRVLDEPESSEEAGEAAGSPPQ